MENKCAKSKIRNDVILALCIAIFALIFAGVFYFGANEGSVVNIVVDGECVETLPLSHDTVYELSSGTAGYNTVVVQGGKVSIASADCPDKICVMHRSISKSGEAIVCLPHKVVVEIE